MEVRHRVGTALEAVLILFVVALIAGQILGQPVLLGFVETGSMQPTLDPGDGFVAIPAAFAGDVGPGDVVTFRSENIQGGGLTTHRVVAETERGFVTKGDSNPFTDQDNQEPPVKRTQIVAVVWRPGGSVLSIPGVGTAVTGTRSLLATVQHQTAALLGTGRLLGAQGLAYLLLAASLLAYAADVTLSGNGKDRTRETSRDSGLDPRLAMGILAGAIVLAATAAMVSPAGPTEFGLVSAETDSPGLDVVAVGTNESATYVLGNGGTIPMVTYFDPATDGIEVEPSEVVIPGRSTVNTTLTLSAPPETGYYRRVVVEHRYLYLLPRSVIDALYGVHPWLPIVAIDAFVGVPFYLLGVSLMGDGRVKSRNRNGPSRIGRIRSRLTYDAVGETREEHR